MFSTKTNELGTKLTERQIAFAQRNTINALAFETRKHALTNIEDNMITRNKFTERSILVERARRTGDKATIGSTADYMLDQEFGGRTEAKGQGVPIPTSYSAGQGMGTQPRRRMPRKPNRLASIRLSRSRPKATNKRQRNLIAIKDAIASGRRVAYIDTGRRKFIARVTGGKRNPQVRMLHDLTRKSTPIPKNPWLSPATDRAVRKREAIWRNALRYQLAR